MVCVGVSRISISTSAWVKRWTSAAHIRATKDASAEIADEAGKGEKVDREKLKKLLRKLDAACANCHPTID